MKFSWVPFKPKIGRLSKIFLPKEMIVPILQGRLKGKKWIIDSGVIEYALGSYESDKVRKFEKIVQKGCVVYDIGAHVGYYALLASELVKEKGRVIAFEPNPQNLKYLRKHLEMNRCTNVKVVGAAVSDKEGTSSFNVGKDSSTGHLSEKGNMKVVTVSIDELVDAQKIPPPNYMKIDVEGAEMLVLQGARLTLTKYDPKIFLATHSHKRKGAHIDCINFLNSLGYKLNQLVDNNLHTTREIFAYREI